jgi:hypothetical protein
MKTQRYFISEYASEYFFHGGIGIIDAEKILERNGYIPVRQPHHYSFSLRAKLARAWYSLKILSSIKKDAIVVFIHPMHARLNKWLCRKLAKKVRRCICIIGDIDGLKDGDDVLLKREIDELRAIKYFILHNQAMVNWLNQTLPGKSTESIEFFDFLSTPNDGMRINNGAIVFAGNLDKSRFLEQLEAIPVRFNLYGPGATGDMLKQTNVNYHGIVDPYQLPAQLEGSYGLVWDGDSASGMKGSLGYYMQYISHHKVSLYILAGLPIIISQTAGAAALVRHYQIGICVNSLEEIRPGINAISASQYQQMINNMKPIAKKIAAGDCLSAALERIIKRIS